MAYPTRGFMYVEGPNSIRYSTASSAATFKAGNPVAFEDETRTLKEADSGTTAIFGIALADAQSGDSIGGAWTDKVPVLIPTEQTVFAAKVQTGVAASGLEIGESLNIEKSGDYYRVDTDSKASAKVVLVERGLTGVTYDSADSSVHCQFLKNSIYPFGSNASAKLLEA